MNLLPTVDDYNAWKDRQTNANVGAANVVINSTEGQQPDDVAAAMTLGNEFAKQTGRPVPPLSMVMQYRPTFEQLLRDKQNSTILTQAPRLAEWLRDPANAVVAKDDLANLSWWDGAWAKTFMGIERSGAQIMANLNATNAADQGRNFGEIYQDAARSPMANVPVLGQAQTAGAAGYRFAVSRMAQLLGLDEEKQAALWQQRAGQIGADMAKVPNLPGVDAFNKELMSAPGQGAPDNVLQVVRQQNALDQLGHAMQTVWTNPLGFAASAGQVMIDMIPTLTVAAGGSAVTGSPAGGIAALTLLGAGQEPGAAAADVFARHNIDVSTPEGAMKAITSPEIVNEVVQAGAARTLVMAAANALSGGVAGQVLHDNPLLNVVAQQFTQALIGSSGEAAAEGSAGQPLDLPAIVTAGLANGVTAPFEMAALGAHSLREAFSKARSAEDRRAFFTALSGQATASKLRARLPDTFRQFVDQATADGPIENVYVPADKFVEYFQSRDLDPYEVANSLEGVTPEDLRDAVATGGDLKIPTASYAAHIAGSEHDAFLMDNMRFNPDDFTSAEAKAFNEHAQEALQAAYEEAERVRAEEERYKPFDQEIYDTMVSRLRAAGRSTEVATTEAHLYPAFYRVMAERSGMAVDEFMRRYPLPQVRGALPEGMQLKNTDALTRTLAEARARRAIGLDRATPLLDFISNYGGILDPGGELAARDAEVIKRGRGKKTLRLVRSADETGDMFASAAGGKRHGLDDVAHAAVEAGFMADDPAVLAYKEALRNGTEAPDIGRALLHHIDEELAGRGAAPADDAAAKQAKALDDLEAYLANLGVSLDEPDDVIRAALEKAEANDGKRYAQVSESLPRIVRDAAAEGVRIEASEHGADVTLHLIDASKAGLGQGMGSKFMSRLTAWADANGKRLLLTPDVSFGASSRARLVRFYKRFGFKENSGKSKDFTTRESMIREPQPNGKRYAQSDRSTVADARLVEAPQNTKYPAANTKVFSIVDGTGEEVGHLRVKYMPREKQIWVNYIITSRPLSPRAVRGILAKMREEYPDAESIGGKRMSGARMSDMPEISVPLKPKAEAAPVEPENKGLLDRVYNALRGVIYHQRHFADVRGSVSFPSAGVGNGDAVISLFQKADLSTFLHESGHYFLTVMQDLAARGEGSAVDDLGTVKDWWYQNAEAVAADAAKARDGVTVTADDVRLALDGGTTGDAAKDDAIDVGMQEQFARAFEAYLMDGKAPSADLRAAFEKFRAWLISIYRTLTRLNVKPSEDLQNVFDRMLASDQEIEKAKVSSGDRGIGFASPADLGLTDDEYAALVRLHAKADDDARAKLLAEALKPVREAREQWFKDERAKTRESVERQINAMRPYRALEWMGNRRWLGADVPEGLPDMRLSKDILVERYGEGVLKTLPRGRQTVYAVDGGLDPDEAAGWFGFRSGDELVRALETAPPRRQAIENETDRVMRETHGDALNDGSIEADALDAVHNDARGQALAAELKALTEVADASQFSLTHKEARRAARETLARMKVRDAVAVNRFIAAERKAGEEAAHLAAIVTREKAWVAAAQRRIERLARKAVKTGDAGAFDRINSGIEHKNALVEGRDLAGANSERPGLNENVAKLISAKQRQLLNHMLFDEARKVADEVRAAESLAARLGKKSTREHLAGDYLEAIDELLDRYDFRKVSGAAEQRRASLLAYVERMKADGRENELAIPDAVLTDARRIPYKTLSVEHLRGVVDSLKNIEHTARLKQKLIDAKAERELDAVVGEIAAAFDANLPKRPPGRVATKGEGVANRFRQFLDLTLNANTILRDIDGRDDLGPAFRNIKQPIDEAANRLVARRRNAALALEKLYEVYSPAERRRMAVREDVPALGQALSKWERIAIALNTGNAGNYQRLTDGNVRGSYTPAQVEAVLASLDDRDARFVQSVWDYLESFRADIAAREKRVTGVEPAWVEARPVTIGGRDLRGGYYPLRYDPRLSSLARDDETQDVAKAVQAGRFGKAQTRNGHLKDRAAASGRDVLLDMGVLHRHVNQVVYDLELSEPVANAWRILQDGRIRQSFRDAGRQADFDALEVWLKDVAEGGINASEVVGSTARRFKSNFTAAKLAFNLSTVALQMAGLSQSMVVVGKKDFMHGALAAFGRHWMPLASLKINGDEIAAKSEFMRERQSTFHKDIYEMYSDPTMGPIASRWHNARNKVIAPLGLWLMTKVQYYAVDIPTWLAGYRQGLRRFGGDEAKAVAHADNIVKRAQGSGMFQDQSSFERGSLSNKHRQDQFLRLFSALGSYMFAKFNVAYERSARAKAVISKEGVSAASAKEALSWMLDNTLLFSFEAVMGAAIRGHLPSSNDNSDDSDLEKWAKFVGSETALSIMATMPFIRDLGSVLQGFGAGGAYGGVLADLVAPFKQAGQGKADHALVRSVINATGDVTGLPATQINRAVDAGWRQAEGQDVMPAEYVLGRLSH